MPVESAADRAAFFDTDEFGVAATYTPAGGSPVSLDVIFDREFATLLDGPDDTPGIAGSTPVVTCRSSDLPGAATQGDAVTIDGTAYTVQLIRPDGTGISELHLHED